MTGGRLRRVREYLGDEDFCFTYGDGVSDVDLGALIDFHRRERRLATLTAVRPPERFGVLELDGARVARFHEKPRGDGAWINGGYFVLSAGVFDYLDGDDCVWEREPLERLAAAGQLGAWLHEGFWYCMDTLRDRQHLETLWREGRAPWRRWA